MNHIYNLKLRETHSPAPIGKHKKPLLLTSQIRPNPNSYRAPQNLLHLQEWKEYVILLSPVSGLPNPYNPWGERYISLHLVDSYGKCIGKYTVRPMDASSVIEQNGSKAPLHPAEISLIPWTTKPASAGYPRQQLCHVGGFPANKAH